MEEFGKRAFVYPLFLEYCRLDIKYYQVEVKCKDRIRIYNKKPDVILAPEIKDIDDGYTDDCIFNIEYNNDYNDIILKFKHKGTYKLLIFAGQEKVEFGLTYYLKCTEEWGDEPFEYDD